MQDKVQRHQIFEIVMESIKGDIASGKLKAGDRIETVRDLAQRLGVGQSSVREAVRVLSYMGLLRIKHGGGIFVTEQLDPAAKLPSRGDLLEDERISLRQLLELRLAIEPLAARLAAERATAEEGEEILRRCNDVQRIHKQQLTAFQNERDLQDEDVEFHLAIARAAHNPLLLEALEHVHPQLLGSRQITSQAPQLVDSALRFHPQIAASILAHDALHAESFMRSHIEDIVWWLDVYDKQHTTTHPELLLDNGAITGLQTPQESILAAEIRLDHSLE